ncbi:MAG: STAS domain-containing protein [Tepidisphaeraceae bacterium]|jgi:anti-anti-sigma factor
MTMAHAKWNTDVVSAPRREGDAVIAEARGEIDLQNSSEFRSAVLSMLDGGAAKRLILNLSRVPYMDSSAVAVLVEALQKLRPTGGRVMLVGLQPRVRGLLEIARLDSIFILVASEQQALAF